MSTRKLSPAACRAFRKKIYDYFRAHCREFSWRKTREPYHILVSEVMLQQTQTDRVETKFKEFITAFPGFKALAKAPLGKVLKVWQGMGYNRRALFLQKAAKEVIASYGGALPRTVEELETLPGIGPATARSIAAYAFNLPVVFIETNIRTVYIHEFFKGQTNVSDDELKPLVEQTLDRGDPWKWYNALMDYGVMLKKEHGNLSRKSRHYKKQSPFMESDRRVRGMILRLIAGQGSLGEGELHEHTGFEPERLHRCLAALLKEGLLAADKRGKYRLP
jgi:A/G-specific adenine glycosylase